MIYATHTGTLTESEVLLAKLQEIDGLRQQIDRLEREIARLQGGAVCPFCGAAARSGDVFCRECGQKLYGGSVRWNIHSHNIRRAPRR